MSLIETSEIDSPVKLDPEHCADPWFWTNCSLSLYRGCQFDCTYCDGKATYYNIPQLGIVDRISKPSNWQDLIGINGRSQPSPVINFALSLAWQREF
ncbi:MAG TPA: hypothetical protein VJ044_13545 [Candidatus Hodarchaeales archaeon]|nr:hypothetical protein [Candidatus Hodarchaeales archaeon]